MKGGDTRVRRFSTTNEAAIRECIARGLTIHEMAAELDVCKGNLSHVLSLFGLKAKRALKKQTGGWAVNTPVSAHSPFGIRK